MHLTSTLVVDPHPQLDSPYSFLQHSCQLKHVQSADQALQAMNQNQFELYIISASYSPEIAVKLLNAFKNSFQTSVIPLIIVVDLNQPLSTITGTHWGGKVGILHSQSSQLQTLSLVDELLSV